MRHILKYSLLLVLFLVLSCNNDDTIIDTKPVGAFTTSEPILLNDNESVLVSFTDASFDQNGSIAFWLWDFGDGTTSTEPSPSHTYTLAKYTVTLTVTDNSGNINVNPFSKVLDLTVIAEPIKLWSFTLPGVIEYSAPAISDDGTAYIGITESNRAAANPNFLAINNGTKVWETLLPNGASSDLIRTSPSIASDGSIYMTGFYERNIYKINSNSGAIDSKFYTNGRLRYSAPTYAADGTVYIGSYNNTGKGFYALDPSLPLTPNWIFKPGVDFNSTATIGADGTIYVGALDGYLYAINPDGTEKWSSNFGTWTATTPAIGPDGTIYFAGEGNKYDPAFNGVLAAYDPANGNVKWSVGLAQKVNHGGPAVAADGTIYVGGQDKKLIAYNPDGSQKWSFDVEAAIEVVPAIDNDGNIYFGDIGGSFYVLTPDGQKKWKVAKLGDQIRSSVAIGNDGTIYVGVNQLGVGKLMALKTNATGLQTGGWPMYAGDAKHSGR
ncbi:MAG: PQQ-binding-like beta-propeller repeat protein [Flavobacteriaceae bacterium]|nr:PQQ-binding-like beta-propeller repeat protein [Flavobacteriaceae bacterium]